MPRKQHYSHTISVVFVQYLMKSAERLGIATDPLLQAADISPRLLDQPRSRVSPEQFARLVRTLWQTSDEETLGMASPRSKYGVFTLVANQLLQCKDLREVLTRGSQLYNLLTDGFTMTFEPSIDTDTGIPLARYSIEMRDPNVDPDHMNLEFLLIIWHRFPGWMIGERIPLYQVTFKHDTPVHVDEFRFLYPAPCLCNQDRNSLVFDARWLDCPVIATARGLRLHLARAPLDWFIRKPFHPRLTSGVMRIMHQAPLDQLPGVESVAAQLNISVRSLRRKLEQERSGFQQIKDNFRRDQTIQLLGETGLSIAEIGHRLGYEGSSSFIRSFKQWAGVPPGTYRKHRLS